MAWKQVLKGDGWLVPRPGCLGRATDSLSTLLLQANRNLQANRDLQANRNSQTQMCLWTLMEVIEVWGPAQDSKKQPQAGTAQLICL